ncbi:MULTISPECIES: type VI secretion system membrane subunit TssM [unclassified Pseudomonas]|uniref:type VI secretion system membrane subunit TssM n=1 Tax=unclassified Pseudomonas TaxID=196821 RepID=UPI00128D0B90|nr:MULTISPECIES: type VI secretion system membrane subunit TssM [unclassified Pseudomonas]MPQ71089.1 type VI secretion system membrane subunit TssM [Pseudomonas sp. MWU12-2323]
MKNFFKTLAGLLAQSWLWSLLLTLSIALLVWFVGPLIAVADYRFWDDTDNRLFTLCGLLLCWGLFVVFTERRRAPAVDLNAEHTQTQAETKKAIAKEQRHLRKRFKDALHTLHHTRLYRGHSEHWRKELPWYLLLGPEGSGKTSLLDYSGIHFPLNRNDSAPGVAPKATRHCDWYFAENGVLLDTSGRYLTQNEAVDTSGWHTLLKLLRQRRRNRPLNGVVLCIPIQALQNGQDEALQRLVEQLRRRLLDIHRHLHSYLPIYLVLTQADEVKGFEAFYEHLSLEESQQVLGLSFDKTQRGSDPAVLCEEFQLLLNRLEQQTISRLYQERNNQRREDIYSFTRHLGQIGDALRYLVSQAFAGNRYEPASQLRGVYFTSAPRLGIADKESAYDTPMPSMLGTPRFIHHLLNHVVFPEAGLANLDKKETRRIHWRQRALYVGALGSLALFGLLWTLGFSVNHQRQEQLRSWGQKLGQQWSALNPQDDAMVALDGLDSSYAATQVFPPANELALHERAGLYQGEPNNRATNALYQHELEVQLLPRIARQLEGQIRANLNNREVLQNSLRAYLMLNLVERRDPTFLKEWLATDWNLRYAGNTPVQEGLSTHFSRLLDQSFSYPLNDSLIADARQALHKVSQASLVYRALQEQARGLPEYRLDQQLGPRGSVFASGQYVIPGLYTQRGYQQFFLSKGALLTRDFLRDNWVMGQSSTLDAVQWQSLMADLEQLYFKDYAHHWSEAIGKLALQPLDTPAEAVEQAAQLTDLNSPLLQLLIQIRDNTRFPSLGDSATQLTESAASLPGPAGIVGKIAAAGAEQVKEAVTDKRQDSAKRDLQQRFEPLHRLLDDESAASAELIPTFNALNDLQQQLAALSRSNLPDLAAFDLAKARMGGQRDALSQLLHAAQRLPQPVKGWLSGLSADSWSLVLEDAARYIDQRYKSEVYSPYLSAIHQRYPFNAHSSSDVALADFREFFKAQGVMEGFFETYLKPFVSRESDNYRLRSVEGHSLPISRVILQQMSHAHQIRRSFFAERSTQPLIKFSLEPYSLDSSLSRAEFRFGDQVMEYRHGPIVPSAFEWPNTAAEGFTSLVVEELGGRQTGIQKNTGPWSLFRLFDLMQTEPHRGRDVLMLKADVGGLRVNYLLMSQRSPHPFDMSAVRSFRLPAAL